MELLVIGGTGQVGEEIKAVAASHGVAAVAPTRDQLDLSSASDIARWAAAKRWTAIINAGAYTQVDAAERETALALEINARAPGHIAAEIVRLGLPLIHISTDYVFDGRKGAAYVETDPVHPINAYGASKEAGERAIRAATPQHIILRTSWLHSPFRQNFVKTMLRLAQERDQISVVADQQGCPTAARDIAQACLDIAMRLARAPAHGPFGTYHLAGEGGTTWYDFAKTIFAMAKDHGRRVPIVKPITTAEYPTAARRPQDSRLDCRKIFAEWNIKPRPWKAGLEDTLTRILAAKEIA